MCMSNEICDGKTIAMAFMIRELKRKQKWKILQKI
jgi:hypothetical protein